MGAIVATLGAFLLQIVGSLAARVLVSLGIAIAAAKAGDYTFSTVKNYFISSQAGIPADLMQLMSLYGFPRAFELILGSISFVFSMNTANKAVKFVSK